MKDRLRRVVHVVTLCFAFLLIVIFAEVLASWRCELRGNIHSPYNRPAERTAATSGIPAYARPEGDAFLSYPEWYIVWSYQEKADFQEHHLPSGFPYFDAVQQYWSSYCCIFRLSESKYPTNFGEHLMLVVIGTSFSAEYILKGAYEKTLGRLTEWTSSNDFTQEDEFAYRVAREYADFVHIQPFYEFHFAGKVPALWTETDLWGAHPIRKWERKLFLTADYTIEASYCWIIEKLTRLTYGHEPSDTYAWIDNTNANSLAAIPLIKVVKRVGPNSFLVDIPRYQEFTKVASELASREIIFVEIAGNSQIALSVIVPRGWEYEGRDAQQLFDQPNLTNMQMKRVVLSTDVASLHLVLGKFRKSGVAVEHIYDY